MSLTVAEMLAEARRKIRRLDPQEAREAVDRGALLVDIRPVWQRAEFGAYPGALIIERNHLEWRLDPTSDARIAEATSHDVEVIVACQEGYTSSLAAAALIDLGLHKTADLKGGFVAWEASGLPVEPGPNVAYRGEDITGPTTHERTKTGKPSPTA
jgi:rhodanese-related sulfurtransferase